MSSMLLAAMHAQDYAPASPHSSGVRGATIAPTEQARRVRADIAAALAEAMATTGAKCAPIALLAGLGSGSVIERMVRGEVPVSVEKLEMGSPKTAAVFYRMRAEEIDASPRANRTPMENAARASVQVAEALQAAIEAGPDVDAVERARIRRELLEAREALDVALADLEGGK